ncbi:DUF308 domain-containing protein [Methylotuvimicrobium sp. KM1]|uniref:DUF308 domain-containing protein n=1 Tax=Methylotuvimicrobium sp. KM1 TaxID=3377707 RepID=UPI00384B85E3
MISTESKTEFDHFLNQRNTLLVRGLALSIAGILLTVLSALAPGVRIMNQNSSWLPIVSIVILVTGFMACYDTFLQRQTKEFYVNLQIGVLDTVFGLIILTELNKSSDKLILLAAAYLLIKGIFRIFAAYSVRFSHFTAATLGGLISVIMGLILWQEWFGASMWFISFCLSVDIMTRGWALTRFGIWLKTQYKLNKQDE